MSLCNGEDYEEYHLDKLLHIGLYHINDVEKMKKISPFIEKLTRNTSLSNNIHIFFIILSNSKLFSQ